MLWTIRSDLYVASRSLLRRPGFATIAVLTIAIGIGANAAVFSVINAALLKPLPYPAADELVLVEGLELESGADYPMSFLDIQDLAAGASSFAELAPRTGPRSLNLIGEGGSAERVIGEMVPSSYFRTLGVSPTLGRTFTAAEDLPGDQRVALLGHDLWERRFGADPAVLGESLDLDGRVFEIVGVLDAGFRGLTDEADLWLPISMAEDFYGAFYLEARGFRWLSAVGRLHAGVSLEQATAELEALARGLEEDFSDNLGVGVQATPLAESVFGDLDAGLYMLWGAAAFLLLIACTNVAGLLLARANELHHDQVIRVALGAGRRRLLQRSLAEGVVLGGAGLVAGLWMADLGTRTLVAASAADLPSYVDVALDPAVIAVMATFGVAATALFSVLPALLASRVDIGASLRASGRSVSPGRVRLDSQGALVVVEVAMALMLLIGAGLMVRGFASLRGQDFGFETERVLTARMDLKDERYLPNEVYWDLTAGLRERIALVPGVVTASLVGPGLPTDDWNGITVSVEDRIAQGLDPQGVVVATHSVTPDFFASLRLPLLDGRDFGEADRDPQETPWVVVVSEEMASRSWPGEPAVGKRIKFGGPASSGPWIDVIGVVANANHRGLSGIETVGPDVYFSIYQLPARTPPTLNIVARASGETAAVVGPVREIQQELAPTAPLFDVLSLDERLAEQATRDRFLVILMGLFAGLSLLLAAVGIYGVIALMVTQRTREMGIRMALGAGRPSVLRLVVARTARLCGMGAALGLVAVLGLTRVITAALHGVSPTDPATYAAGTAVLLAAGALAALPPALRATRVDPLDALRDG